MPSIISDAAVNRRSYWISEIDNLRGTFGDDSSKLQTKLSEEFGKLGIDTLVDHLRLCGDIPESYHHDSSQEKLYAKYTDCLALQRSYTTPG